MNADAPIAIMFAGPNGAGKTTTAIMLLRELTKPVQYVNADVIAQGLSGGDPDSVAIEAGGIMLKRLHQLADANKSLAFETTGASRTFAAWVTSLKTKGYSYQLYFFWLASPEAAIARVAQRVRSGGHDVPAETIRRRYERGLHNFFKLYTPLADGWELIDNNAINAPHTIAKGGIGRTTEVQNGILWESLKARYEQ